MTNSMEVKRKIGGSVKLEVEYLMIDLETKIKHTIVCTVLYIYSVLYHESIKALCVNCMTSSSLKGKL